MIQQKEIEQIEEIKKVEDSLMQAMLNSDVNALDNLIFDDLIFTDHTGRIVSKAEDLEAHRAGHVGIELIEPSEQLIKVYGQTSIVSVLIKLKGRYLEQPFEGTIRYTRTWLKRDGAWQIVAGQATMAQEN